MKTMQNFLAGLFILSLSITAVVSILGIWEFLGVDVIWKSFQTIGLLAVVSLVVLVGGRFMGNPETATTSELPNPIFHSIRNLTVGILVASSTLLAIVGVLAIWEVIQDGAVVAKALSSLAVLAFASFIIVMVCLEREQSPFWLKRSRELGGMTALAGFVLVWILLAIAL